MKKLNYPLLLILMLFTSIAHSALTIEIVGVGSTQLPIAITKFGSEDLLPQNISNIISADLQRSGLFKLIDTRGIPIPAEVNEIRYDEWRQRGAEALVIGSVVVQNKGQIEVRFRLIDSVKRTQLAGFSYTITGSQVRATAHKIADVIYEKLTGDVGVFSTKITYVVKRGNHYELQVADADGYDPQTIVNSNEPIISPTWSPDGSKIAYVSFEMKKPIVYVQSLISGQRQDVAKFKGSNSAPSWSPDGKRMAVVLSKDGSSQIYLMNNDGSGIQRLTHSNAIDTEPHFSPDGKFIIFTSDRGGGPQIYQMPASGGQAERLTFEGDYNVSPSYSPDGKSFSYIHRNNGRFNVAVRDLGTHQMQILTDSNLDESPSYAPNGKMLLYATEINGRGILAAVSSDGRVKQRLTVQSGDVREPAWGPLLKN